VLTAVPMFPSVIGVMGAPVLMFVLVANGLVTVGCFYGAWRVWCYSRVLARAADVLTQAEESTYRVLREAPQAIARGQLGVMQWRYLYTEQLTPQFRQVKQALAVLGMGLSLWQGRWSKRGRSTRENWVATAKAKRQKRS